MRFKKHLKENWKDVIIEKKKPEPKFLKKLKHKKYLQTSSAPDDKVSKNPPMQNRDSGGDDGGGKDLRT